jgi:hypothetical protein
MKRSTRRPVVTRHIGGLLQQCTKPRRVWQEPLASGGQNNSPTIPLEHRGPDLLPRIRAVTFDCTVCSSAAARFMLPCRATASNTRRSANSMAVLMPAN